MTTSAPWPHGRVGFVTILGRPNVGKSTLLNKIMDFELAAVSPKPQTTRRRERCIYSTPDSQIIFLDTPGIHRSSTRLGEIMDKEIHKSLDAPDAVVCVVDASRPFGDEDGMTATRAAGCNAPVVLVINKCDLATETQRQPIVDRYQGILGSDVHTLAISALTGENIQQLIDCLTERMPQGPFLYPPDELTDSTEREIGADMIRAAAMEHLRDELPHSVAVDITMWKDPGTKLRIDATLYVGRTAHKPIVVGKNGAMINQIRSAAVQRLRRLVDRRVDLRLHVKVAEDWPNHVAFLRSQGLE